jgi:hypothetical protein
MYVACILVATCWILTVALAVIMEVCVYFWQPFLGTAMSLPWIYNRHFHFIRHIHSLVFLATTCLLQLVCTPLSSPWINQVHSICRCHFSPQEIISRVKDQLLWSSLHFSSLAGQLCKWVEDCDAL